MGRRVFEAPKASWPPPIEPDRPWIVHGSIVSRCAGESRSTGRARAWRERHSLTRPRRRALHGARRAGSPRHDPTTGRRRNRRHATRHTTCTRHRGGADASRAVSRRGRPDVAPRPPNGSRRTPSMGRPRTGLPQRGVARRLRLRVVGRAPGAPGRRRSARASVPVRSISTFAVITARVAAFLVVDDE